jgi:hypothetical protein
MACTSLVGCFSPSGLTQNPSQPVVVRSAQPVAIDPNTPLPGEPAEFTNPSRQAGQADPTPPADSPNASAPGSTDQKYPPAFSSQRNKTFPVLGGLWNRTFGSATTEAAVTKTQPPSVAAPMWRWYGYGAPTPGRNPYAPQGTYAPVNPNWYAQSGATPGAIPENAAIQARNDFNRVASPQVQPEPTAAMPRLAPGLPQPGSVPQGEFGQPTVAQPRRDGFILPPPDDPPAFTTEEPPTAPAYLGKPEISRDEPEFPATINPQVPNPENQLGLPPREEPAAPAKPDPSLVIPELSSMKPPAVTRAQAPANVIATAPPPIVDAIRSACAERVLSVEIQQAGPKALVIRIEGRTIADAQAAANQIAALKVMSAWHVVYQAVVR